MPLHTRRARYFRSLRDTRWPIAIAFASSLLCAPVTQAAVTQEGWRLMLTWSPEYCRQDASARGPECDEEHYFVNHGLAVARDSEPSHAECVTAPLAGDEADRWLWAVPNQQQIVKVWRDEGSCSGLDHSSYFAQVDRAGRRVVIPETFDKVSHSLSMNATEVRSAFVQSNPGMEESSVALICTGNFIREVQICMDGNMEFVPCGDNGQCAANVKFRPIRLDRQDYKLHSGR